MDPSRFCQLQLEVYELQAQIRTIRQELKTVPEQQIIDHISQQPGDLLPVTPNFVVTLEIERRLPVITQGSLLNYLLKFWRDCDLEATDETILQKAQQQFDIMMEYRIPELAHRFKVVKTDDVQKYTLYRINNQKKRLDKGILKPARKRKRTPDQILLEPQK